MQNSNICQKDFGKKSVLIYFTYNCCLVHLKQSTCITTVPTEEIVTDFKFKCNLFLNKQKALHPKNIMSQKVGYGLSYLFFGNFIVPHTP